MAGNSAYYKDFREHLSALEERGKLVRISRDINKDTELMPLVRWQFRGLDERERKVEPPTLRTRSAIGSVMA